MSNLMDRHGSTDGYQIMLDYHPAARDMLHRARELRYLKQILSPEEFMITVVAVMKEAV